jgi:hypothetical protein
MKGFLISVLLIVCAVATVSCLTSTSGSSASPTAAPTPPVNPANARINAINAELVAVSSETTKLQSEETATENQRNESMLALSEAHGHGPHMVHGISDGEISIDPGMMISMHSQNVTIANTRLGEIRTQIASLTAKAGKLKNDRAAIEATLPSARGQAPIGSCFTPDTLVMTQKGLVPISLVQAESRVMTYDEATGQTYYRPVVQRTAGLENHYFIINGNLRVTALHRFMTDTGWKRASEMTVGTLVATSEGMQPIQSIHAVAVEVAVSNLEVEKDHDFYVSDGTRLYLVHNTGGGGGGGGK